MILTRAFILAGFQLLISANPEPTAAPQFDQVISYQYQRYSECSTFLETCQPTIAYCASVLCQECTDLGQSALNSCCQQDAAPTACIEQAGGLAGSSVNAFATPAAGGSPGGSPGAGIAVAPTQAVGAGVLAGAAMLAML